MVFFKRRGEAPVAKRASDYAIGESVFLNVNSTPVEFLVVHQGLPNTSLYDSSCNGTWLLMKDIYERRGWNTSGVNDYTKSTIHTYLNGTFLGLFDTDVQNTIKQVKIPYGLYDSSDGIEPTVYKGTKGLSTKIFLPSTGECGYVHDSGYDYHARDGKKLDYFVGTSSTSADPKRIAYYDGTESRWWTRTCYGGNNGSAYYVSNAGKFSYESVTSNHGGVRPMLIVPFETKFHRIHDTFLEA